MTATYVLVHRGGHGGWCYGPVARRGRQAGHDLFTPTVSGVGERLQPFPFAMLHPLCGGMPIDVAWGSLELFEQRVLPAFA